MFPLFIMLSAKMKSVRLMLAAVLCSARSAMCSSSHL
jgi:hypothetical protein